MPSNRDGPSGPDSGVDLKIFYSLKNTAFDPLILQWALAPALTDPTPCGQRLLSCAGTLDSAPLGAGFMPGPPSRLMRQPGRVPRHPGHTVRQGQQWEWVTNASPVALGSCKGEQRAALPPTGGSPALEPRLGGRGAAPESARPRARVPQVRPPSCHRRSRPGRGLGACGPACPLGPWAWRRPA